MRSELILCLWICFTRGVFGDEAEEAMTALGQSVTLHSGVQEYHQISWMFENRNIAKCRNTNGTRSCEITEDRLKIDNQTGSLTIIIISTELAGLYKLQVFDNSSKKTSDKEFNVTVSAPLPQSSCLKCSMQCSVGNVTLSWYKGNSSFSSISVSDLSSGVSVLLKGNEDFSIYSCVMNDSIRNKINQLNITELCEPCPGLYPALICVLVGLVLLVLVGVGVVIYCCCKKYRTARRNGCCWNQYSQRPLVFQCQCCEEGCYARPSRHRGKNSDTRGVDGRSDVKRETVSMINSCSDEESPAGIDEELQPNTDTCVNIH